MIDVTLVQGGAAGIVAIIVGLILTGRLVPRSQVKDLRADRDMWRDAYWRTQQVNDIQTSQMTQLLDVAETTNYVLKAIPPNPTPKADDAVKLDTQA